MSTESILAGQRWLGPRVEEADQELAGDVVRVIRPDSEASIAALLIQAPAWLVAEGEDSALALRSDTIRPPCCPDQLYSRHNQQAGSKKEKAHETSKTQPRFPERDD